jgi:hypothetical protein
LGVLVFVAVGLSWYIWAVMKIDGLLDYFIFFQTARRISGKDVHCQSIAYFIPVFLGAFMPWSLFLPALIRDWWNKKLPKKDRRFVSWVAVWSVLIFLFFSVIRSKLASYILPMTVPFSIWTAVYFSKRIFEKDLKDRFFVTTVVLTALTFWAAGIGFGIFAEFFITERLIGLRPMFFTYAFMLPILGLVLLFWVYKRKLFPLFATLLIGVYLIYFNLWNGLSKVGIYKNVKSYAETIAEMRKPDEPVIAYQKLLLGLPYYLKERVCLVSVGIEKQFTAKETVDHLFYDDKDDIRKFINDHKRCFILTKESDGKVLEKTYGKKIKTLQKGNKLALYVSVPG